MQHSTFVRSEDARLENYQHFNSNFLCKFFSRRSYWARNFAGWPFWSSLQPNTAHRILNDWEKKGGILGHIVTQNVDQLHFKAGCNRVVELHGTNSKVR